MEILLPQLAKCWNYRYEYRREWVAVLPPQATVDLPGLWGYSLPGGLWAEFRAPKGS